MKATLSTRSIYIALGGVVIIGILIFLVWKFSGTSTLNAGNTAFARYIDGYTTGVISKQSPVRVRLAAEIATLQQQGNETRKLFTINPSVKGQTHWVDARTVEFRPEDDLQAGKTYQVSFALNEVTSVPDSLRTFRFDFTVTEPSFEIDVHGLQAQSSQSLDLMKLSGTVRLADHENPDQVEKLVAVTHNNQALPIKWVHEAPSRTSTFTVDSVSRLAQPGKLIVSWDGSPISSRKKDRQELEVPAKGTFKVLAVKSVHDPEQYVLIQFSDPLLIAQDLNGLIGISSTGDLRYTMDGSQVKVYAPDRLEGNYTVTVNEGVENIANVKIAAGFIANIHFENRMPSVSIPGKGTILPGAGKLSMPFEAINLRAVDVTIIKIYENNVTQYLQSGEDGGSYELRRVGRPVVQKTVALDTDKGLNLRRKNRFALDIDQLLRAEPGAIYRVTIGFRKSYSLYECGDDGEESTDTGDDDEEGVNAGYYDGYSYWGRPQSIDSDDEFWSQYNNYYPAGFRWNERDNPCSHSYYNRERWASRDMLASNIGLIAKRGNDHSMQVIATDIITTQPLSGVTVSVLDYQQQVLQKVTTNADGIAELTVPRIPYLVLAAKGNERAYMRVDDGASLPLSRFDVDGDVVQNGLKGFIYGERGVWRPGDSIHVSFILEDKMQQLPENHPVSFELYNPKGQLHTKMNAAKPLNGFYTFPVKTEKTAPTGNWQVKVLAGGAVFRKTLKIETVMPNRLKIDLDFGGQNILGKGGSANIGLTSRWLFGAAVQQLKAKVDATLSPAKTTFPNFGDYTFDDPTRVFATETQVLFDGTLNEQGKAVFAATLDASANAPGMLRANFTTRVFEPGGNFSIDYISMPFSPFNTYIGVKVPPGDKLSGMLLTDKDHEVKLVAVDANGKPAKGTRKVQVEFYKIQWRWWWSQEQEFSGNFTQNRYNQLLKKETITLANGTGNWTMRVNYPDWGRYLIRVTDPLSGHSTGKTLYIDWPGWAQREQQNNPTEASMLSFTANKAQYQVGEEVTLTIPSSEGGRGLISLENGSRVLKTYWAETQKGQTTYKFKVDETMAPNIFVNVTLLQPHSQTANDLPIRMYGVIPLKVENPQTILKPVISMPASLKPETKSSVTVSESAGKAMTYTVAIVDEGLLDLTRFKTPDPHSSFYAREALGVKSWDLFDQVLGAWGGNMERILSIGGDEDAGRNIHPAKANRFVPVVKFLGPFTLKKGGKNTHEFTLPQYVGSIRTMVIAGQDGAYGFTEKAVAVKKPLMLLATLPRVIGPGEQFSLPVTVFAMENTIKNVSVTVSASGGLQVSNGQQTLSYAQPGEKMMHASVATGESTGVGKIRITAKSGNETAVYETELDIRNPNPYITSVDQHEIGAGANWQQQIPPLGQGGNHTGKLELSSLPAINLEARLSYLIQYPHGCVEQITSGVFPQLVLANLTKLNDRQKATIDRNVKAGVHRFRGYQLADGGIGYWPGAREADEWSTNYTGHFMLAAEAKGYPLPAGFLAAWKRFQKNKAQQWTPQKYNYRGGDLTQAYRLYLLALANAPELGAMNRLRETPQLSDEARWRLAAAYALAGQSTAANQLTKGLSTDPAPYTQAGNTFGSALRDRAMILEALVVMKRTQEAERLLTGVAAALGNEQWYSTQTTAYALLAIANFMGNTSGTGGISFTYTLNGRKETVKTDTYLHQVDLELNDGPATITVSNSGSRRLYARVVRTGQLPAGQSLPSKSAPDILVMNVRYTDARGTAVPIANLTQGTDFIAEVTIKNTGNMGTYEHMALTQIFPSGWEIINTRISDNETAARSSQCTYQDIRDDRVLTYFNIRQQETLTYRVLLNASYAGRYFLPGVACEAMYDDRIQTGNEGMWVNVTGN